MITKISKGRLIGLSLIICHLSFSMALSSCSDWDDHYDEASMTAGSEVTIYDNDIISYMKSTSDLSAISAIFQEAGIYNSLDANGQYTFVVCDNATLDTDIISDKAQFARYCVADGAVAPNQLVDGFGINNLAGKTVWVYEGGAKLDDYNITKTVKTTNGYVYYIDGTLPVRQSAYEYLLSLGDDYSDFKALVTQYDQRVFDREHSEVIGINNAGETVYDSVWVTRNTLMDRYTDTGIESWNMRDENYSTTLFIPSNTLLEKAIDDALANIPVWLNREATDADRTKFEEWIVKACFMNKRMEPDEVSTTAADFNGIGGYQMVVDEQADETTYKKMEPTYWRPSVQKASLDNQVILSNGTAYFLTDFKIPNHVVIYRVKTRLYQIWEARNMRSDEAKDQYFTWTNLGGFASTISTLTSVSELVPYGWPNIDYNLLSAIPTEEAVTDSLTVGVEYTGLVYNEGTNEALECYLPAGEYYLRMGFDRSSTYHLDIYFNDELVISNLNAGNMNADRIANDIPTLYGIQAPGYPEGFNPEDWMEYYSSAAAYDTDGYTVGIVTLKEAGNFKIRVESSDLAYNYKGVNTQQLLMYHWCLRPTKNNY